MFIGKNIKLLNLQKTSQHITKNNNSVLTRELSSYLKGIAILLMVLHHSLSFPNWYVDGVAYDYLLPYIGVINKFAGFAVVPMFLFLTGYTYYFHVDKTLKYSFKKIISFLLDYWLILFSFAGLAVFICGYKLTGIELVKEMFTASNNIMIFSWFVFVYIEVMLFLPVLDKKIAVYTFKKTLFILLIIFLIVKVPAYFLKFNNLKETFLFDLLAYFTRNMPVAICGYLCAQYNILERLENVYAKWVVSKKGLFIVALIIFYNFVPKIAGVNTGLFLCPMFIATLASFNLNYNSMISRVLLILGKHSMNIWFLHCLFFAVATRKVFQPYAFLPGNPALVIIWIVMICTLVAIPVRKIQQLINKIVKEAF